MQEASKHEHLLPQLIARLYARYRELTVREIREDEHRYNALLQDIENIQEGRWDEGSMRQDVTQVKKLSLSPKRPSQSPGTPHQDLKNGVDREEAHATAIERAKAPLPAATAPDPSTVRGEPNLAQVKIDSVINHPASAPTSESVGSAAAGSRVLPSPQQSPTQADVPNQQPTPTTRLPLPRPSSSGYRLNSPSVHHSPYAPSPPAIPGTAISPGPKPLPDGRLSSSVVLPPPPSLQYPPPAPNGPPYPGSVGYSRQQYGQPASRYSAAPLAPNDGQHPYTYSPNQYSQHSSRPSMPPPQQPTQLPHPGGIMLPPFQLELQTSGRPGHQQTPPSSAAVAPPRAPVTPTPGRSLQTRLEQPPVLAHHTPSQIKEIEHIAEMLAPKPATPTTKWRKWPQPPDLTIPRSPTRPAIETLSPVKRQQSLPEPVSTNSRPKQPRRRTRAGGAASEERKSPEELPQDAGILSKPGRTRSRKARGGSVSSSAVASSVRDRTRSQSVISHAESSAQDTEPPSQQAVKPEPPSTPSGSGALSDVAASDFTPTDTRITRHRGGTLQYATEAAQKRKRPARETSGSPLVEMPPSGSDKQQIVASRNLHRTSLTIMNDISSHKYASYFAQPVTERQAAGYRDIIYQSQDLRTIKGLINTGSKIIGGMASTSSSFDASQPPLASPGGPSSAGTVVVPANPNIMPPNAIVNSSQLEKEIMRMFANAVMFNTGNDGMVKETREMAEDVQGMVRHWRGAERTQTGTPVQIGSRAKGEDEEEGVEEEAMSKRRKL